MSYIDNIAKNSHEFSFTAALADFINNIKFKRGYNEFAVGKNTKDAYIWSALSAIGDRYAETIYENVIDYLDNASNVDLCKIKALQSMMQVVGLHYDVFDTFKTIPVEIANLMDILSINKSYLLNSDVFQREFLEYLSSEGCILESTISNDLSNELAIDDNGNISSSLSSVSIAKEYIDESKYHDFLHNLYMQILKKYVYLKYADAEDPANLPTEFQFIYQYIQSDILASQTNANIVDMTPYQKKMAQLKIKYNIDKDFDQQKIVDDIENGYDSIDKYNIYEQEILKAEILYREQTYAYPKRYANSSQSFLGFNLTRYSYYREKKVKEYFNFIDNTYNNLMIETGIVDTIAGRSVDNDSIISYDKDVNYFDIDQANRKTLLTYDPSTGELDIQVQFIDAIAELLANQTLQIAEIRDQVKLQIRKSYMRGTFLLMSYIVNEFLKYGILDKYGSKFSTQDGIDLGAILGSSISSHNNVKLIEYYDDTEYFNITTPEDKYALYSETANQKFWDNEYNKIGVNTEDLPLDDIEHFYLKQMKLERDNVDDIVQFLSIVYEYGANNSYVDRNTGEFTCQLRDGRWIGDPYNKISSLEDNKLAIQHMHEAIDEYVSRGIYIPQLSTVSYQFSDLCTSVSAYCWDQISSANDALKDGLIDEYDQNLDDAKEIDDQLRELSNTYYELKTNSKYRYYIDIQYSSMPYVELNPAYFAEKLENFSLSVKSKLKWSYAGLQTDLNTVLKNYTDLSASLYSKLFALSVWQVKNDIQYWPQYSPQYDNELTTVTMDLKNFLVEQAQVQHDGAMQHLQNHYDKLLGYKEDVNRVLDDCNNAMSKLDAYRDAVEAATGVPSNEYLEQTIVYWDIKVSEMDAQLEKITSKVEIGGRNYTETTWEVNYVETSAIGWIVASESYESPPIDGSVESQLESLRMRCEYPRFPVMDLRKCMVGKKVEDEYGVAQEWGEIGGYASWLDDGQETQITYEIEYDDNGNEKAVKVKTPWIYSIPRYKYIDRVYTNKDIVETPWKDNYSESVTADILNSLRNAVSNLKELVAMINTELICLGYPRVSTPNSDIDSVQEDTNKVYSELIDRVNDLTRVIQNGTEPDGWPSLTASDANLKPFKQKLDRIDQINLSASGAYNIRYIDTTFNSYFNRFQTILADNADYFEDYSNNDADRLDKQISAASAYMMTRDANAKEEVSAQLCAISSDYYQLVDDFNTYSMLLKRDEVISITDDYAYILSSITYREDVYNAIAMGGGNPYGAQRYKDCLDYLLCGNYINGSSYSDWTERLSGVLYWIPNKAKRKFEDTAIERINAKIPTLAEYTQMTSLIYDASTTFLAKSMADIVLLTDRLDQLVDDIDKDITYISSQINRYDAKKKIYLKYNGTDIGYDPFYNYKNQAYSSYQIHPYLYNFVEKSTIIYPLANSFFVSFSPEYERSLYEKSIDKILGPYGNIKDLWKSGMFDWTSYQTKYEQVMNNVTFAADALNPSIGFAGLFYPPALDAYMEDPDAFIQKVQDNDVDSYYYRLNLTNEQLDKIVQQLIEYEPMVRTVAQRWKTEKPSLSAEFDIYKYAEDAYGNSLFLLKSYKSLYQKHAGENGYSPSYNEKKNSYGEVWMRIKNHPIAFPAFDLRNSYQNVSQYSILSTSNSIGKPINSYLPDIDNYFTTLDQPNMYPWLSATLDTIGLSSTISKKQHLRCFFDMELDPTKRALLLVAPVYTGKKHATVWNETIPDEKLMTTYGNSSIIVSFLDVAFDYNNNIYVYNCYHDTYRDENVNVNINNIPNTRMLVKDRSQNIVPANKIASSSSNIDAYWTFVGFAKNKNIVHSIFVQRNTQFNAFGMYQTIGGKTYISSKPRLALHYESYKCHVPRTDGNVYSGDLEYDIFSMKRELDMRLWQGKNNSEYYANEKMFKNAENIVLASGNGRLTIGFLTERIQQQPDYSDNLSIVNFAEYTAMVEHRVDLSTYGEDVKYPRSTALIQTDDSNKINIYNSFDSFVQHLVNVNFNLNGSQIVNDNVQYFNLNGDLGFMPQYPDYDGTTRIWSNTALSGRSTYAIELLGPENSDVKFTPVIVESTEEKYGRVVEDYKEYNQLQGYNTQPIVIPVDYQSQTYTFMLSDIFPAEDWDALTSTNDLMRYKYILYNTKYESAPILKGDLSAGQPSQSFYQGSETYDLLSGDEVIGPNGQSYQNINLTNHINNVSNISLSVIKDEATLLPSKAQLSITIRQVNSESDQVIPAEQFRLFIYVKNNQYSYKYYHLFENANEGQQFDNRITQDEEYDINFAEISSLPDYEINGKYPFKNKAGNVKYNKMSADLEFKYSEENTIDREFPYLDASDVEDEIVIVQNDAQNTYFFAIDQINNLSTISTFKMEVYNPGPNPYYSYEKVMPTLPKYRDFYNRALTIAATYNIESIDLSTSSTGLQSSSMSSYQIVEYFNYKNFTDPQYIKYTRGDGNSAPSSIVYSQSDEELQHSYLVLKPGESGRLDLSVDFLKYGKINSTDIDQSVLGLYKQNIASYYIMNVSDDKPKFVISRKPFSSVPEIKDEDNYELEDAYYAGLKFRYMMMVIEQTRAANDDNHTYGYVAMSKIKFYNKLNEHGNDKMFNDFGDTQVYIRGGNVVEPNKPSNLIKYNEPEGHETEFFASNITFPLSIMFDMRESRFDVEEWPNWEWLNCHCSNSHIDFIPKKFYIAFSNDMKRWYMADYFNDTGNSIPTTNWQLGYKGQLSIQIGS